MGILRISLFGHIHLKHDDWPAEITLPRITQALLGYLLLTPARLYPRELLMDLFWPDYPPHKARSCMSTALWRLRQSLEPTGTPKGTYLLTTANGEVGFNWDSEFWLDAVIFQKAVKLLLQKPVQTLDRSDITILESQLNLCQGDLLEGVYADWALRERERLRQLYLDGAEHLMQVYKYQQAYKQSITYGQLILTYDPLRESIHRELMRIYFEADQPAMAVRQYHRCRETLARELKIAPMAETQNLYTKIITSTHNSVESPTPTDFEQAMGQLLFVLQECQRAQEKLQQAMALVQQYVNQQPTDL